MLDKFKDDLSELSELAKSYNFIFSYFDGPFKVIRIMIPESFQAQGMDGQLTDLNTFYFELHYTISRKKPPLVFIPSDAYTPKVLDSYLKQRIAIAPPLFKRLLRKDIYMSPVMINSSTAAAIVAEMYQLISGVSDQAEITDPIPATPSPKKFKIKSIEQEVQIETLTLPLPEESYHLSSDRHFSNTYRLYIEQPALHNILSHIEYSNRTHDNVVEQGGIYLGKPYKTVNEDEFGIVSAALPAVTTTGSSTYVQFTHSIWADLLSKIDDRKHSGEYESDWVILGWYHTHPNNLSVFMSGTDLNTQHKLFYKNWNSALVINPHKKLIAGFQGRDAKPCEVITYKKSI